MRPLPLAVLALALLGPSQASANGGGYRFGLEFTGSVAPFQATGTESVTILDEDLDIALGRRSAAVTVRYQMRNGTGQPVTVRFGFPVEVARGAEMYESPPKEDQGYPAYRREKQQELPQRLVDYTVSVAGAPVRSEFLVEPFATGKVKPFPGSEVLKNVAGWMVSEVTFPSEGELPVEIRYSAEYIREGYSVSEDLDAKPDTFVYRLSTGAVWKGPIAKGRVTLRADGIAADEVEIKAPRSRFKRSGDQWTWAFQDLEPTLADDITVYPAPGFQEVNDYAEEKLGYLSFLGRSGLWGRSHQHFAARASSTLASDAGFTYGPEHLSEDPSRGVWTVDGQSSGTGEWRSVTKGNWCEGVPGPGAGEWIEVTPKRPAPMLGLSIAPGINSYKQPALFKANGRPSRVEIVLNGEHRFAASLGDSPYAQFIPVLGYAKPVKTVRITMVEVRPGERYQDACISQVILYDRLPKKPELRGAR